MAGIPVSSVNVEGTELLEQCLVYLVVKGNANTGIVKKKITA